MDAGVINVGNKQVKKKAEKIGSSSVGRTREGGLTCTSTSDLSLKQREQLLLCA
jgi:hypothetical protein